MKNNEHQEPKENRSHVQGIEGPGTSTEAIDGRSATPASTNPSTSHGVDANVIGKRTSEKRK